MVFEVLLVVGAGVLAAALRSFRNPILFRLGTFGLVVTSFLAGWLLGGSLLLGAVFASTWFLLPWVEILTRVRRMRLPLDRRLEVGPPPSRDRFPMLGEITQSIEDEGFEYLEDAGWEFDGTRQSFRLFANSDARMQAAICLVEHKELSFYYLTFSSRTPSGEVFLTWNYPFSYGLKLPPKFRVQQSLEGAEADRLLEIHAAALAAAGLGSGDLMPPPTANARAEIEEEMREQLEHNLASGLLRRDGELIRYSVRGMFFLWFQFLRDFVRMS